MTETDDELAARRLPDWAKKLAEIKLGASFGIGVAPHERWVAENPGANVAECPEHLLEVRIFLIGSEIHPPSMLNPHANPDPQTWPRVNFPVGDLMRVPWLKWREAADRAFGVGEVEAAE